MVWQSLVSVIIFLSITGCGPSFRRIGYKLPQTPILSVSPEAVQIVRDGAGLDEKTLLGRAVVSDFGFTFRCSEPEVLSLLRKEASRMGSNLIFLYDIRHPTAFENRCFQAGVSFYKVDTPIDISDNQKGIKPTLVLRPVFIDSIYNKGFDIRLQISGGPAYSKGQVEALAPQPDGLRKAGIRLALNYWSEKYGLHLEYGSLLTNAYFGEEGATVYDEGFIGLGAMYSPYSQFTRYGLHRFYIYGGLNYDVLSFDSSLKPVVKDLATGPGFYVGAGYDFITLSQILVGMSMGYQRKNPVLHTSDYSMSANEILFDFHVGYKINR